MNIAVVGLGYVGFATAVLLAQKHRVTALDIDSNKIDAINHRACPFTDPEMVSYLMTKQLNIQGYIANSSYYVNQDIIIIATPTHYDTEKNYFDTSIVESVIKDILAMNRQTIIVIKSTVPVGFTQSIQKLMNYDSIIFSPEFLREGKALYDLLYPSRIIVGSKSRQGELIANVLSSCASKQPIDVLLTDASEAEAIKLFSNTYLAMRIAFFNELDSYAELREMNTKEIIEGVSLDPRIGKGYNNPSFGYGGYCLPKDTKQLLANYQQVPQDIIKAIVDANHTRKVHITEMIMSKKPRVVGVYRLAMKLDSDNYRESAIVDIIHHLKEHNIEIIIFEPSAHENLYEGCLVIASFSDFASKSDLIIANRMDNQLISYADKVYTRDVYRRD
jgi:UDPglucose 6-dehydrogenase